MRNLVSPCLLLALAACGPSASLRAATPVANLQSYQRVLVRAAGHGNLQGYAQSLEFATTTRLAQKCQFQSVVGATMAQSPEQTQADLILDLNILRSERGGGGMIENNNIATVDVTVVLSDGVDQELMGSAEIRGKSAAVLITGAEPEEQAIEAVADRIAVILSSSGCTGPRVARAQPTPPVAPAGPESEPGSPETTPTGQDESNLARAEELNDEGKTLFKAADLAGAKARFLEAVQLHEDPRFYFNLCLAHEGLKELVDAAAACNKVMTLSPEPRLGEKAEQRLQIIEQKKHEAS